MPFYKFGPNDIFNNVLKTYPHCRFLLYSGSVYYNDKPYQTGEVTDLNVPHIPLGHVSLYELNIDRAPANLIYPFITKNGTLSSFKTISTGEFNNSSNFGYGDVLSGTYPMSATISKDYFAAGATSRDRVTALKNSLDYYKYLSPHYAFSSASLSSVDWDKSNQTVGLVSIPSIFFGSSIKKGSVNLKFYVTGTLVGELQDKERNGNLVEVTGSNVDGVAGVVLYNEGFMVLTGSWRLGEGHTQKYDASSLDVPRWVYFGQTISGTVANAGTLDHSSSFEMEFQGTNYVPVVTMMAHAPAADLNYSANPTYISHGQTITPHTGSTFYVENKKLTMKNTVSASYADPTGSFKKQTFISKIALYDEKKNLIGIAKLAKPVKKTEERDFTFKLKLDF